MSIWPGRQEIQCGDFAGATSTAQSPWNKMRCWPGSRVDFKWVFVTPRWYNNSLTRITLQILKIVIPSKVWFNQQLYWYVPGDLSQLCCRRWLSCDFMCWIANKRRAPCPPYWIRCVQLRTMVKDTTVASKIKSVNWNEFLSRVAKIAASLKNCGLHYVTFWVREILLMRFLLSEKMNPKLVIRQRFPKFSTILSR